MNGLIKLSIGFASGYALCRALEARARGIPLRQVFKADPYFMLTPISRLTFEAAQVPDPDAMMAPTLVR